MKIIVPIRSVSDPERPIRVDGIDVRVTRWIVSGGDEAAIDEAVRLREIHSDVEIVAVAFGTMAEELVLSALARGADRGYIAEIEDAGPRGVAHGLAEIARREQADFVLMGDDGETGPRLAGMLGVPQAAHVGRIELLGGGVRVDRRLPRLRETLELTLPAVVTLARSTHLPRLISLYDIVAAREKPVESINIDMPITAGVTVVESQAVPAERRLRMVANVDELVSALREEARVI